MFQHHSYPRLGEEYCHGPSTKEAFWWKAPDNKQQVALKAVESELAMAQWPDLYPLWEPPQKEFAKSLGLASWYFALEEDRRTAKIWKGLQVGLKGSSASEVRRSSLG